MNNSPPCSLCEGTRQMLDTFISDVKRWASKPYDDNMSAVSWVLFIGFVGAVTFLWSRVIARILD